MSDRHADLTMHIDDHEVRLESVDGRRWILPLGPVTLSDGELSEADPPNPESLTNALGAVDDRFGDLVVHEPALLTVSTIAVSGTHARMLARVEIGDVEVPAGYRLRRRDAEEVFRMLVAETAAQRCDEPGLDPSSANSVIGTCCVILAIMRRLDRSEVIIVDGAEAA